MPYTDHRYYIPSHRGKCYGQIEASYDDKLFMYAMYMRYASHLDEPGRYDGVSIFGSTIRICVGCNGQGGTYEVFDLDKSGSRKDE